MGGASERAPSSPSGLGFYSPDTHVLPCRGAGCRGVDYGSSATVRPHGAHDQMQPSGLRAQLTSPDLDNRMPQHLPAALLLPEDEHRVCACVCAHVVTHACVRACVCFCVGHSRISADVSAQTDRFAPPLLLRPLHPNFAQPPAPGT